MDLFGLDHRKNSDMAVDNDATAPWEVLFSGQRANQVEGFKYLWSVFEGNDNIDAEVTRRVLAG